MMPPLRLLILMAALLSLGGPALAGRPITAELDPLPPDVRQAVSSRIANCGGGDAVVSIRTWVAVAPDLNGDGVGDWVVSEPLPLCRHDFWPWHWVEAYVSVPGGHFRVALLPDDVHDYHLNTRGSRARLVGIDRHTCPPDGGICIISVGQGPCRRDEANCVEDILTWDRLHFRLVHSAGYRACVQRR